MWIKTGVVKVNLMMSGVSAFLWQAALMLLAAYFLGAFIGCWLRRRLGKPPKVAMEADTETRAAATTAGATAAVGAAAVAATASGVTERFGRALEGDDPTPWTDTASDTAQAEQEQSERNTGAMGDAAARTATTKPVQPESPSEASPTETPDTQTVEDAPKQFTPPMSAAAAAALAARLAANAAEPSSATEARPVEADTPTSTVAKMETIDPPAAVSVPDLPAATGSSGQAIVAAPMSQSDAAPSSSSDDLTLIEGVTSADAQSLSAAGFTTFAAIATWSAADVSAMSNVVGDRRISRENWIEQAQLLQIGTGTTFSRHSQPDLAPRPDAVSVTPVTPDTPSQPAAEAALMPLTEQEEPPAETSASEQGAAAAPHQKSGSDSANSAALAAAAAAAAAALAPMTARAPTADATAKSDPETSNQKPDVSDRAAFSRERRGYADDLQQIDGINAEVEKLLNEQGVTRIAQIAGWPIGEQQRIDRLLGGMNRVSREGWVDQARRISGFVDPEPQPAPATEPGRAPEPIKIAPEEAPIVIKPTPTSDSVDATAADDAVEADPESAQPADEEPPSSVLPLGNVPAAAKPVRGLRSVRSEALVGANTVDSDGVNDDLKHIRGVGVLIEKRLRAMGFTSFAQIGSWTQSDVDRVNQKLDFRGRIERENWIEQARILAAGGQTDFSRRQERGET